MAAKKSTKSPTTKTPSAKKPSAKPPSPAKAPKAPKGAVRFEATLEATRADRTILRLPAEASKQLPSRGQVAVDAVIAGHAFQTVIEPDGEFGHWMSVDAALQTATGLAPGDVARVELNPTAEWPEPTVPKDLKKALAAAPSEPRELWDAITPMARWEWVRWVNETKVAATRQKRIDVSISKLSSGKRRPCCFNLASCTDPELAKSGKLSVG